MVVHQRAGRVVHVERDDLGHRRRPGTEAPAGRAVASSSRTAIGPWPAVGAGTLREAAKGEFAPADTTTLELEELGWISATVRPVEGSGVGMFGGTTTSTGVVLVAEVWDVAPE